MAATHGQALRHPLPPALPLSTWIRNAPPLPSPATSSHGAANDADGHIATQHVTVTQPPAAARTVIDSTSGSLQPPEHRLARFLR